MNFTYEGKEYRLAFSYASKSAVPVFEPEESCEQCRQMVPHRHAQVLRNVVITIERYDASDAAHQAAGLERLKRVKTQAAVDLEAKKISEARYNQIVTRARRRIRDLESVSRRVIKVFGGRRAVVGLERTQLACRATVLRKEPLAVPKIMGPDNKEVWFEWVPEWEAQAESSEMDRSSRRIGREIALKRLEGLVFAGANGGREMARLIREAYEGRSKAQVKPGEAAR
jgi:hypothetical protein